MSHLSVATMIEKDRVASDVAFLTALEIDVIDPSDGSLVETLFIINNNENITYQGNVYTATSFNLDLDIDTGAKPQMKVNFVDFTRAIQSRMEIYRGGVGFKVRLLIINSGNLSQKPEIREQFTVVGSSAAEYVVEFVLGAENPLARRFPFRLQFRDRCQWTYKGVECGYTGELPTCDFTLQGTNGCATHNNTPHFGAYPGIKAQG